MCFSPKMYISDLMLQSEILNVHYLYPQFRALIRDLNRLLQNLNKIDFQIGNLLLTTGTHFKSTQSLTSLDWLEFCNVLCNCKLKLLIAKNFAGQTLNATFSQIPLKHLLILKIWYGKIWTISFSFQPFISLWTQKCFQFLLLLTG